MKRTETVKTYATNLLEQITGLDLITDAQAEAIKSTRIRSLTPDTIVSELADINAPFLIYGRTKNILICTEQLIVLVGEIEVVNGLALAVKAGKVAYLRGDYSLESDFMHAMWSCANKGDLIHRCIKYLKGETETETAEVAPGSKPDPIVLPKEAPAPAEAPAAEPKKEDSKPGVKVVTVTEEPKKPVTLEELFAQTRPAPKKEAPAPKKETPAPADAPRPRRRTEVKTITIVSVEPAPADEPDAKKVVEAVVEEAAEDAEATVKRLAAEEGIDISGIDW